MTWEALDKTQRRLGRRCVLAIGGVKSCGADRCGVGHFRGS